MTAAEPSWLDERVAIDDAARRASLPLLDTAAQVLFARSASMTEGAGDSIVAIDIGAGTGNSMRWFDHHLGERLPGRHLRWVLVDADATALAIASSRHGGAVRTVTAPIAALPEIAAEALGQTPRPGSLIVTGSALLDVLTRDDLGVIASTLLRFSGVGLFLLSITGTWTLTPDDPDDAVLDAAFGAHQRRSGRLGTDAVAALTATATGSGARVATAKSPWTLTSDAHSHVLTRFLTERVGAAIEAEPHLGDVGRRWLKRREQQIANQALTIRVDHSDVLIDAGAPGDAGADGR